MDSVFRRIIWLLRKTVIKRKEKLMFLGGGGRLWSQIFTFRFEVDRI